MDSLKELLFQKTAQALKAYEEAKKEAREIDADIFLFHNREKVVYARHQRFIALYDVIETAELEDEYQSWKETGA